MIANHSIAVEFKRVMKSFGTKRVLNDVSFQIGQGQALCLLGRSGTGKSVTLKLIMALMRPDSGEVWVDQDNVVGMGEHELSLVRRKLGYLFQDAALFDSLTLYENLALPLSRLTKKSKDEIDDVIRRVLTDVGLGADGAKYPSALSGGMRKRAGLARALVLEPKILLADEPSSGLDRITAAEIDELLMRCKTEHGTALIIVTHDVHGARRVADRVAVLDKGNLVAFGSVEEVSQSENDVARKTYYGVKLMPRRYLAVGIFIIAGVTLFALGIFLVGSRHEAFSRHVLLYTEFANLDGVTKGSKVQVAGMDAGQVTRIDVPQFTGWPISRTDEGRRAASWPGSNRLGRDSRYRGRGWQHFSDDSHRIAECPDRAG